MKNQIMKTKTTFRGRLQIRFLAYAGLLGATALLQPASARAQSTETVLHSFPPAEINGVEPQSPLTPDGSGNLYGSTADGGPAGYGTVYKIDQSGHETVLYSFKGGAAGIGPTGSVAIDAAGNVYGTTLNGGGNSRGLIFKIDNTGHFTVLHTFTGNLDGGFSYSGVIIDPSGNLYGTASIGGPYDGGDIFTVDPAGDFKVVYGFMGGADGSGPNAGVFRDPAGNLYGTTLYGGAGLPRCSYYPTGCGTVYKVDTSGHETVLHAFRGDADGSGPYGGVVLDREGNIYGTTYYGGTSSKCSDGCGTIYKIDATGKKTIAYSFSGADGFGPESGLTLDSSGNLYGTTVKGGAFEGGVVFKLAPNGQLIVLHSFPQTTTGPDGTGPETNVTVDALGDVYGTTPYGGPANMGAAYRLDPSGQETILPVFEGVASGNKPDSGLTADAQGNLYGTTFYGGSANAGILYKITPSGAFTVISNFPGGTAFSNPQGPLARDAAGNFYGAAGTAYDLVLLEVNSAGQATLLYAFNQFNSLAAVSCDAAGNVYGAGYGSTPGEVFTWNAGSGFSVLYTFTGGLDGGNPRGGLIYDAEGNLYGTASAGGTTNNGVVFELSKAAGYKVLYSFAGGSSAGAPASELTLDPAGNLYGIAISGGAFGYGGIFKLTPGGVETLLYSFPQSTEQSAYPSLILDKSGNLYGAISSSLNADGTVYQVNPSGTYTALYNFTGGNDGGSPAGSVILDPAGNLYGTASTGGSKGGGGVVFKLSAPAP